MRNQLRKEHLEDKIVDFYEWRRNNPDASHTFKTKRYKEKKENHDFIKHYLTFYIGSTIALGSILTFILLKDFLVFLVILLVGILFIVKGIEHMM